MTKTPPTEMASSRSFTMICMLTPWKRDVGMSSPSVARGEQASSPWRSAAAAAAAAATMRGLARLNCSSIVVGGGGIVTKRVARLAKLAKKMVALRAPLRRLPPNWPRD